MYIKTGQSVLKSVKKKIQSKYWYNVHQNWPERPEISKEKDQSKYWYNVHQNWPERPEISKEKDSEQVLV